MKRGFGFMLAILGLFGVAAVVCAVTFQHHALFHHARNPYCGSMLDSGLLRSRVAWHDIFTSRLLLTSGGEYLPVGYAGFALINRAMPVGVVGPWHAVIMAINLLTALLVFGVLRPLVGEWRAWGLAAGYLLLPFLVPLNNDVNLIYQSLGLLLVGLSCCSYMWFLRGGRWGLGGLALSLLAFGGAMLTTHLALIAPAFLITLTLLHREHPRAAAGMLAVMAVLGMGGAALPWPVWIVPLALAVLSLAGGVALGPSRRAYVTLGVVLPLFIVMAIVGTYVVGAVEMLPAPFRALELARVAGLMEVNQPWFTVRALPLLWVPGMVAALLLPATLAMGRRPAVATMGVVLVALLAANLWFSRVYADDLTYWQALAVARPNDRAVRVHLGDALNHAGQFAEAKDLLLPMVDVDAPPNPGDRGLFDSLLSSRIGAAMVGLGQNKLAGFRFFHFDDGYVDWYIRSAKNCQIDGAEFALRSGYPTTAELYFASTLVLNPYDVDLYDAVGRVLIYKNFYRAGARYLEHALMLQPDDATALYYLAFIHQVLGEDRERDVCVQQWRGVTGQMGDPDFRPIYAAFGPRNRRDVRWFSADPVTLAEMYHNLKQTRYSFDYEGTVYEFSEWPLALAQDAARRGDSRAEMNLLMLAHQSAPRLPQAVRALVALCQQQNLPAQERRWASILETLDAASTQP